MGAAEADIGNADSEKWTTLKVLVFTFLFGAYQVSAWTYHYGNTTMIWDQAQKWCQNKHTNMVFIRNINENEHLNETLPGHISHYWIGIKKNNTWTWVETQKPVPKDVQNWATDEPSFHKNEVCVELYMHTNRTKQSGKWNNISCGKRKIPLCYQASCMNSTCSHHGECTEDIGNYTCECWPGFHGNNCEHAVSCVDLQIPADGKISCNDEYGRFQYKSFCNFSCDEGYELNGTHAVFCPHSGEWSEPTPTCLAVSCVDLQIIANGTINCTNKHGKYQYKSFCDFSCDEGYAINGTKSIFCQNTGEWSEPAPTCLAWNGSFGKQKQIAIVSSVLGTVGLSLSSIPIVYLLSYLRKKKKENSHIIKTMIDPPNTFENPVFEDKDMPSLDL